jgi:hypothetical protein
MIELENVPKSQVQISSSSDADIDLNEFDCDEDIEGISHPGLVPDS